MAKWLNRETVSVQDDFFESGGNSLSAVGLVNELNAELQVGLPVQILFDAATVEALASRVDREPSARCSRLVRLRATGSRRPIYCWPGLGGYPMNLKLLAGRLGADQPFSGSRRTGSIGARTHIGPCRRWPPRTSS